LLGDISAKVGREYYYQTSNWEWEFTEISNDNGFESGKLCHLQKSVISTMFQHSNIHKFTWTSDGKTHKQVGIQVYVMSDRSGSILCYWPVSSGDRS
jgi:hypothetical protein